MARFYFSMDFLGHRKSPETSQGENESPYGKAVYLKHDHHSEARNTQTGSQLTRRKGTSGETPRPMGLFPDARALGSQTDGQTQSPPKWAARDPPRSLRSSTAP